MGQGFAQRQGSGVRGCLRVSNVAPRPGRHWNWVPGVVDGLGRDGSHLHFGGFLGSLAIGTPVTKVSRSLQYWLIKAFVQLWLLVLEATRLSSVFMSLGPVFKLLCHIQPQGSAGNLDFFYPEFLPYWNHTTFFISSSPTKMPSMTSHNEYNLIGLITPFGCLEIKTKKPKIDRLSLSKRP